MKKYTPKTKVSSSSSGHGKHMRTTTIHIMEYCAMSLAENASLNLIVGRLHGIHSSGCLYGYVTYFPESLFIKTFV